jgi:spermidine dehydrogenase
MSELSDKQLGMSRRITRRDFMNGAAMTIGAAALSKTGRAQGAEQEPQNQPDYAPPSKTGMRGSHPGSFEVAHKLRDDQHWDLSGAIDTRESYDLVVVGGGISGLAAAHYFLKSTGRHARVLVLENHDDFGGHAKRNEFTSGGKLLVLNGGTLNIESPLRYNAPSKQLLHDIGIDLDRYENANKSNDKLYASLGLGGAYFFDKETWKSDLLAISREPGANRHHVNADFIAKTPISPQAQKDFLRLFDPNQPDYLPGLSSADKKVKLAKMSYNDYLTNVAKVDPQVIWFFQTIPQGYFCVGTDATPALFCWEMGLPGFAGLKLEPTPEGVLADLPGGQHGRQKAEGGGGEIHFPDGNATVARLLVRWLIPDAVPGTTMEDVGLARVRYGRLDRPGQPARIRLNSTVVNAQHVGDRETAKEVIVSYVTGGKTYQVHAGACVMACWNMIIPYLVPDIQPTQAEALRFGVKGPLVYTNVALRNWKSFQKLGISRVSSPTMYHANVSLAEAVSLGDLHAPQSPDDPIVLRLDKMPCVPGLPRKAQHRAGRVELLGTTFESFERNIRDQLARILGPGGFDPAQDITAITVNRWPHGYAYTYSSLYDPMEWVFTSSDQRPCVIARQPFGLISIANSDAAASPHTDAAMLEAHRAVDEVLKRRTAATSA